MKNGCFLCATILLLAGLAGDARGQWVQQDIPLVNGWNAVYLTVQPHPVDLNTQMAGLPVRAVHRCARVFSTEQFSSSPASPLNRSAEWLVWYPPESPHHVVNTLSAFLGATPYLIECYGNATWTVTGYPVAPRSTWVPDALNFVGLPVNPSNRPTFSAFFSGAAAMDLTPTPAGGKVFAVLPSGEQQDISSQTATLRMEAGKAYWIKADGMSDFTGPTKVRVPVGGLRFDGKRGMLSMSVRNDSASNRTVSVRLRSSAPPPAGMPTKIGDVPLLYFEQDEQSGSYGWQVFDRDARTQTVVMPGNEGSFSFAADRSQMSDHGTNATWQSLLEVTDDAGTLVQVPVAAEWGADDPYDALWPEGLWVGAVSINAVSYVQKGGATHPLPVSAPFVYRLILHQGSDGVLRLLQQVVTVWNAANGSYELLVADRAVGAGNEAYRISSSVFPPKLNVTMTGNLLAGCSGSYTLAADDPANPWRHVFHPNHNKPEDALAIENTISLTPQAPERDDGSAALWQPEEIMKGIFSQVITGLRKQPVTVSGTYEIKRVSKVGVLK